MTWKNQYWKNSLDFVLFCQKHSRSSKRFKFIIKNDDVNFNFFIIVNIMYIENSLIVHVIDQAARFQVAKWLQNISAKHIWEMLRLCWIDVYLDLSDHILINANKNFASNEFCQFVTSMTIIIKTISIEAFWYDSTIPYVVSVHVTHNRGSPTYKSLQLAMKHHSPLIQALT
jgi:hypothetical protein